MLAAPTAQAEAPAGAPQVKSIRLGDQGKLTRFVVELDKVAPYTVFTLADPYRVVIDLPEVAFNLPAGSGQSGLKSVHGYRYGLFQAGRSRIVIDVAEPVALTKNFALSPQGTFGYRIVLDLGATDRETFLATAGWPAEARFAIAEPPAAPSAAAPGPGPRKHVIVLDPGHGGVDPGTHGPSGIQEKNVVLAFSQELKRQLDATGRYKVLLTRSRDEFIPLRERVNYARRSKADLFISIHADAIQKKNVRGMSVYTLSETASDKEAAELARKENLSDVIAGIDLGSESSEVTDILIDLAQRETKNFSARFAKSVVRNANGTTLLLPRTHRFAGFRVLKAPDVPSVLIELGFLTNPDDERQLTSTKWRNRVAESLVESIDSYFGERIAEGSD